MKPSYENMQPSIQSLLGCRFRTLDEIMYKIKCSGILHSESELTPEGDFMIDYYYEDRYVVETMYYLRDRANNYYITEV